MNPNLLNIIHITVFFLLSITLFWIIIPSKQEYIEYKKARRILGFALMLVAISTAFRILFPAHGLRRFLELVSIVIFAHIFTSLNFISFLYLISTSRPLRKVYKKTALISGILLLCLGIAGYIFVEIRSVVKVVMGMIFMVVALYEFTGCIREYDKLSLQRDRMTEEEIEASCPTCLTWMPSMLWATTICAIVMASSFFYKPLGNIHLVLSTLIYTILTIKLLNFIPNHIIETRNKISKIEELEGVASVSMMETTVHALDNTAVQAIQTEKTEDTDIDADQEINKGYMKIKPLVDKWVENEEFMQADITIKEAASQMGTNSNYLSLYMNKYLNTSFSTWLNTLRIEKSKYYLTKPGKLSIEECGIKVGYPNIYNYSRWFKIVTGMSPSEWRKIQ
jgi:AraC-like DNA-binding protein/preprotein translocase subunit Sss1